MRARIQKSSKSSWVIILSMGFDPITQKYKTKWITVRGPRAEAERRKNEILRQYDLTGFIADTKTTTGAFLARWIDTKSNIGIRSKERYTQIIRQYFIPEFGKVPLTQLRPDHIQAHLSKIQNEGLSASTARYHYCVIHGALETAVKWVLIYRNAADAVELPKIEHSEMQYWDADEMNQFLQHLIGNPYYPLFYTALFTGMRRSELLGLRWGDMDLLMCQLSVRRTLQRKEDGSYYFTDVKSKKSKRTIDLTPSTVDVLRRHCANSAFSKPDDLVFAVKGEPMRPNTITRAWQSACSASGVKVIRFHDSRHTHATLLLKQGVHPKIVQERLGHSTIAITLDTYSHVIPGLGKAAAQKFDELLLKPL
jgi:integrase